MQIGSSLGKLTSSRGGAIVLGIAAAVLAAILLAVYVTRYRDSVKSGVENVPVLQASHLIPKGTPGELIATKQLYQPTTVAKDQVALGAITDPAVLTGRVSITAIYPGHQLTLADFTSEAAASLNTKLTGAQRAITLTVDATRGSLAHVASGDHIDIYQQLAGPKGTIVKLFRADVLVLGAPGAAGGNLVLQVNTREVPDFLFAWTNTSLAFAIRPATRAAPTVPTVADFQSMLQFTKPH